MSVIGVSGMIAGMRPTAQVTRRPLTVRAAEEREADDLAALLLACFAEFETQFPRPAWNAMRAQWADARRLNEALVLVAHLDGRLAGTVTIGSHHDNPPAGEPWPARSAIVRLLAVHPSLRRRGVALSLTEECLRRAGQLGAERVTTATTPFMVAARGVFERCGFLRAPQYDHGWAVEGSAPADGAATLPAFAYVIDV